MFSSARHAQDGHDYINIASGNDAARAHAWSSSTDMQMLASCQVLLAGYSMKQLRPSPSLDETEAVEREGLRG